MNSKALLALLAFVLWSIGSCYYYDCKVCNCCGSDATTTTTTNNTKPEGPLMTKWSSADILSNDKFADYKSKILADLKDGQYLEIVGHYHKDEVNNTGYQNLGLARAQKIRELLGADIDPNRIKITSKLLPKDETVVDSQFDAASFNYLKTLDRGPLSFILNSSDPITSSSFDDFKKSSLAGYNKRKDDIEIVGYYYANEVNDSDYANLGLARANAIKELFKLSGKNIKVRGELINGKISDREDLYAINVLKPEPVDDYYNNNIKR